MFYIKQCLASETLADVVDDEYEVRCVDQTNDANKLYGTSNSGAQTTLGYGTTAVAGNIVQRDSNGQIVVPQTPTDNSHATSKQYVDNKIADILTKSYQNVDISEYPTLQSFLESDGVEGYIYLYPLDTSDLTKGYYMYTWEQVGDNYEWEYLGKTIIDLSDYYTKSQADTLLANKVDKTSSGNKVYGTASNGSQKTFDVDNTVGADGNIVRRASGTSQIMVPLTPTANGNASSKKYVDDGLALKQNTLTFDNSPTTGSMNPVTSGGVKSYVDGKVANLLRYQGTRTVAQINAIDISTLVVGDFYNISDNGVIEWTYGGQTHEIEVYEGDNIAWTGDGWDKMTIDLSVYDDKFISAGFFEVQAYNDSTGEITMVYASELYDMNYNGNTGVLTIEAN